MGAFEEFVESDLFFPVLIGLLLLLILVFVVVLISDRKREKKYIKEMREEFKNNPSNQTIQIPVQPQVIKQVVVTKKEEQLDNINKEIKEEKKEEPIIEKVDEDISKGLDLTHTVVPTVIKEMKIKPKAEERTEIADDAPVIDLKIADTSSDESLEATQVIQVQESEVNDDELIVPEQAKQIEEKGEEIILPEKAVQVDDEGTQVIELPKVEDDEIKQVEIKQPNAFEVTSDGNTDINENIKYEPPKEYTGVKTEVLDISDIVNKEE